MERPASPPQPTRQWLRLVLFPRAWRRRWLETRGGPRAHIFTPYLILTVAVALLLGAFVLARLVAIRTETRLEGHLIGAGRTVLEDLGAHGDRQITMLAQLAYDEALVDAMTAGDMLAVRAILDEYRAAYGVSQIMLLDDDQRPVVTSADDAILVEEIGDIPIESAVVAIMAGQIAQADPAIRPGPQTALIDSLAGLMFYNSIAVSLPGADRAAPVWYGTLMAGTSLQNLLDDLRPDPRIDLVLYGPPGVPVGSTRPDWLSSRIYSDLLLEPNHYQYLLTTSEEGVVMVEEVHMLTIDGEQQCAVYVPLTIADQPLGVLGVITPDSALLPFRLFSSDTALLLVVVGALVVEVLGATFITIQILDPIFSSVEEENARVRAILGSMADGVVLRDPQGEITLANPAAHDLLPMAGGSLPAPLADLRTPPGGEPIQRRVDLGERMLAVSAAAVRSEGGEYYGDVLVLRDITHEAMVERTKDNFLDHIGHELRTPLTVIKGYVDVMRLGGESLKPVVRERAMDAILDQTQTLARMIDEVIELTGLVSTGRRMLHVVPLEINELVTDALDAWELELKQAGLTPELTSSAPHLIIDGDSRRLRRVLDALFHNACRYSPQGGSLRVEVGRDDGHARLSVGDSGVGISAEDLPRIFDRFFRGEPVDGQGQPLDTRGTGQGLYAVKTIVEAHGGTISAASVLGAGTTITIRLPLAAG